MNLIFLRKKTASNFLYDRLSPEFMTITFASNRESELRMSGHFFILILRTSDCLQMKLGRQNGITYLRIHLLRHCVVLEV